MTSLEDLNRTQVVLLTVLISFVTSIATGIITASLLSQAPASVTQTIDRVIEHTIDQSSPASATSTIVREVTVVKEEDEVTGAIQSALPSVVRISGPLPAGGDGFFGLGAIVSKDGLVIGSANGLSLAGSYTATLADGTNLALAVVGLDQADGLILWKLASDAMHLSFDPLAVSRSDAKLGQTVIAIEGKSGSAAAVGRVTSFDPAQGILTSIAPAGETAGSSLVNLSGELSGIKLPNADQTLPAGAYAALPAIRKLIQSGS